MVMYDNEYKTKENKNWTKDKIEPRIKLNHNTYTVQLHCPITAQIMAGDSQSDLRFCCIVMINGWNECNRSSYFLVTR